MVKIDNFYPTPDSPAGLKDNISFTIKELLNSEGLAKLDGIKYASLSDLKAQSLASEGKTIYFDSQASSSSRTIIEAYDLAQAANEQISQEIQSVATIRSDVYSKQSAFCKLTDTDTGFQIVQMTKGETVKTYEDLTGKDPTRGHYPEDPPPPSANAYSPYMFTKTLTGSRQKVVKPVGYNQPIDYYQYDGYITTDLTSDFHPGDNISVYFPNGFALESLNPNVFFSKIDGIPRSNVLAPRDVVFLKVMLSSSTELFVSHTSLSPTFEIESGKTIFSTPEIEAIKNGEAIICHGVPVLYKNSSLTSSMSLTEAYESIQSEIPYTRLFFPFYSDTGYASQRFFGNLDRQSLSVVLLDDDGEATLVDKGEAKYGSSLDLKLITSPDEKTNTEVGDVNVTIKLFSSPAEIPIFGAVSQGASAVKLNMRITQTPKGRNKKTTEPGEFYFNYQIKTIYGEVINLNKYGTIRIFDKIVFKTATRSQNGSVIETRIIHGVDVENGILVLDKALSHNLPSQTICEIAQTPLNANRAYRVRVSCLDKSGVPT